MQTWYIWEARGSCSVVEIQGMTCAADASAGRLARRACTVRLEGRARQSLIRNGPHRQVAYRQGGVCRRQKKDKQHANVLSQDAPTIASSRGKEWEAFTPGTNQGREEQYVRLDTPHAQARRRGC